MQPPLRRHDLFDVAPDAWREATAALVLAPVASGCIREWVKRGRPAIVRRRIAGDPPGVVPLAIQLPNACGRFKLTFAVPSAAIAPRAPITLAEAARSAPHGWAPTIEAALKLADAYGMPRVYGGLLWQHLIGQAVLRETSDLDLLWQPAPDRRESLVGALARLDGTPRLDGEIVLEDGAGVSWRELHAALQGRTHSVAAKTVDGVALRGTGQVLHEPAPC